MANQLDAEVVLRLKNLEKVLNDVKRGFAQVKLPELNFSQRDGQNLIAFIRALSQSGPQVRAASQNLDQFNAVLGNTARILNATAPGLRAYSSAQRAATAATTRTAQAQRTQVSAMEDLGRQTAITVRRFAGFLIARDLIFGLGFAFRSSITDAIKFEREISKIAQLQNTSLDSARQLGKFIGALSVQFGTSATELAKSSQVLAQAGKSAGDIQIILKSLGQASLTPTFGDLTKTTDSLLAVLGQFNLKAQETSQVFDILNSVSKEFNVSVDELFEGIRRSGSTFAALSGVKEGVKPGIDSLKEFVALFTSVIDTSRESAETIGTAFRTILPRLLRGNTRELLKKELGLDLLDDKKQFIGPFKAIQELFKSLGSLKGTDVNLSKIVEELGGTRQFNRILPLILEFPKAQKALDLANKSSGSVAKDTEVAFQTLAVQLEQVKQKLQELGRDLVSSGTFRVFADSFLIAAKSAATLVRALEPLLPLITALATAKAAVGIAQFGRGLFNDGAFRIPSPVRRAGGGNIDKVSSLLTPGELIVGPRSVRANGEAALRKFNATGDISSIRNLKDVSMVPGTGNTDSVHANLAPGSFVIKKSSVQKALGLKKYAQGGAVRLASGGPTFGLNPQLGGLDPATTSKLIRFGGELSILGESTKNINRLFKSLLSSSRDLPTALQRIALEVERAGGPRSRLSLAGGGTSSGSLRIPQVGRKFNSNFVSSSDLTLSAANVSRQQIVKASQAEDQDFANAQLRQSLIARERQNKKQIIARAVARRRQDEINAISSRYTPVSNSLSILDQLESGVGITPRTTSPIIPSEFSTPTPQSLGIRGRAREASIQARRSILGGSRSAISNVRSFFGNTTSNIGSFFNSIPNYADPTRFQFGLRDRFRNVGTSASNLLSRGRTRFNNFVSGFDINNLNPPGQGTNIASIAAILGGGALSNTGTKAGSIGGGALSGAGFGLQAGIATGNPLIGAAVALGGAFVGATTAAEAFSKQLRETNLQKDIGEFLNTDGKSKIDVLGNVRSIRDSTGGFTGLNIEDLFGIVPGARRPGVLPGSLSESFRRAPLSERLSALYSSSGKRGDVAKAQQQREILSLKESLIPANQLISSNIIDQVNKGKSSKEIFKELSQNQLEVLATSSPFLNNIGELNNVKRTKELGEGVFNTIVEKAQESFRSVNKLKDAMSRMNNSISSLELSFDSINASLRRVDVVGENFDKKIQSILNPSNLTSPSKLNIFRDISGVPTGELRSGISGVLQNFQLNSPQALRTADSALASGIIQNDLSKFILNFKDQNSELGDVLRDFTNTRLGNFNTDVVNSITNAIDANFSGDKNVRIGTIESQSQLNDVISILTNAFDPAVKIFEKIQDVQQSINERTNAIVNQRTGVTGSIADQSLNINQLRNRRFDIRNQLMGLSDLSNTLAPSRVDRDLLSLTGGPTTVSDIVSKITELQKGGITADEATPFNNLVKALDLLRTDTRVLDATLTKNNQLQEAAQGARSIFERLLSGPDERAKINQEQRDLITIANGGQVSGPRTLAALRTGQQFAAGLTTEQFSQQFGVSKEQFQQNLNKILGIQGVPFFGKNDAGFAANLRQNLSPDFSLVRDAGSAIDTQIKAAEAIKALDEQRVKDLNALIQEQSTTVAAAINDAFASEQVQGLTTALTSLKDAQLTVTGKTEVVVSFNNANGVFKDIQDDLKDFIGGVVNEQIKSALQNRIAGANTA